MKTSTRLTILAILAAILLWGSQQSVALAAGKPKLEVQEETTYTVLTDERAIQVHTTITLLNHDPATRKKRGGGYYYYDRLFWELPKGITNLKAKRGDGTKLKPRIKTKGRAYNLYTIPFRRKLLYNQKTILHLDYTIAKGLPPFYISKNVVSLPGYTISDENWVTSSHFVIEMPADFEIEMDAETCTIAHSVDVKQIICEQGVSSQRVGNFLFFEGIKPSTEKELVSEKIPMQEQDIQVRVRYAEGEEEWAQKVIDVLTKALPELEKVMGFPYHGSGEIEVVRSTAAETMGYEGIYEDDDTVRIHPSASRATIVHEGAHLWSWIYGDVWLSEGWAEWSAREVVRRLKMDPEEAPFRMPRRDKIKKPLQDWEHVGLQTEEDEEIEGYGYAKSYDMMKRLKKLVGLKALQSANLAFAQSWDAIDKISMANSYSYLEWLLQHTKNKRKAKRLRKLWKARVLNEQGKLVLSRRDKAWKRARALEKQAKKLGWKMPASLQKELLNWQFYTFNNDWRSAQEVIELWQQTQPLLQELDWQEDDLLQKQFEEKGDWSRTVKTAKHRLTLAQQALEVQNALKTDESLSQAQRAKIRALLDEAGLVLQQGNSYKADKLLEQARALAGLDSDEK